MALICKLSHKVGQYVTNKRDFQILVPAHSLMDHRPVAHWGWVQTPTKHQGSFYIPYSYEASGMALCATFVEKEKKSTLWIPVFTGLCISALVKPWSLLNQKSQHLCSSTVNGYNLLMFVLCCSISPSLHITISEATIAFLTLLLIAILLIIYYRLI